MIIKSCCAAFLLFSIITIPGLPTPGSKLPTPDSKLSTPDSRLPTLDSRLSTPDSLLQLLTSGRETSLRGLSVVSDQVIWVSGSKGTVGRSVDGGKSWQWTIVKGFEKRDFRDIEAFDDQTAVITAIAEPANILKTTDGGQTWKTVFTDSTKGMFLDAMSFLNNKQGIVVGDPIRDTVFLATTEDGGDSWQKLKTVALTVHAGEAFFAASGTNILYQKNKQFALVSGGKASRLLTPRHIQPLDIIQGREMTGANSIAAWKEQAVIVAGDYENNKDTTRNCLLSADGMKTWYAPTTPPHGYRSCVIYITGNQLLSCGTSGVDLSTDKGLNWQLISTDSYHVCQKAKKGNAVFLAGGNGKIAKLIQ